MKVLIRNSGCKHVSVYKNEKKYAQLVIVISYVTVCMIHSHWLLSYLLLDKMMNTTERAVVMLLFVRRSSRISAKKKMQCSLLPVFDVKLGDAIDLDGGNIMHSSMLKGLKLSHDLFS